MKIFILLLTAYWLFITAKALRGSWAAHPLPPLSDFDSQPALLASGPSSAPTVSIVIAARNEEARVGRTLDMLMQQTAIDCEVIVVNDRSDDRTASIVESASRTATIPIRLENIDHLPDRWLGKCHACGRGAEQAQGDWLLFTDADIHMREDVVARAMNQAAREGADHLTLLPNIEASRIGPQLAILGQAIMFTLYTSPEKINRDRGQQSVGVGAFNLIRRDAYAQIGGHEALRMEVLDDMKLGKLIRNHGLRQRVYSGLDDIQADWAQSIPQVISAMEKNWFAAMDYSIWKALPPILWIPFSIIAALLAPWYAGLWGLLAFGALATTAIPGVILARRFRWPWIVGACSTLGWLIFIVAGVHSAVTTLRNGGIRWRDRFYRLDELRAGLVK